MLMLVDERRDDVGILRLIGFRRRRILLYVLAEGLVDRAGRRRCSASCCRSRSRAASTGSSSGGTTRRWSSCASRRAIALRSDRDRRAARRRGGHWPRRGRCSGAKCSRCAGRCDCMTRSFGFAARSLVRQPGTRVARHPRHRRGRRAAVRHAAAVARAWSCRSAICSTASDSTSACWPADARPDRRAATAGCIDRSRVSWRRCPRSPRWCPIRIVRRGSVGAPATSRRRFRCTGIDRARAPAVDARVRPRPGRSDVAVGRALSRRAILVNQTLAARAAGARPGDRDHRAGDRAPRISRAMPPVRLPGRRRRGVSVRRPSRSFRPWRYVPRCEPRAVRDR